MTFAEMIAHHCDRLNMTRQQFADKCDIPVELIEYLEDSENAEHRLINRCAVALNMKVEVFRGEEKPEPTFDEKYRGCIKAARFPEIRAYLLDPQQCRSTEKALSQFGEEKVSIIERNLILHLSTNSLYRFCETNSSTFKFDDYLFKLHNALFLRYEKNIDALKLSGEEKQDRLATARNNVFACDSMESIAIRVVEPFAEELEVRLKKGDTDFDGDLDLPLRWDLDDELMKILLLDAGGTLKREIKLLSVKEQKKKDVPAKEEEKK